MGTRESVASNPPFGSLTTTIFAAAGTDITTQVQSAINTAVAAGQDLDLYIVPTTRGALLLSGASQIGTAFTYSYAGQVLFPARTIANGRISIRIRGATPPPQLPWQTESEPASLGGTILLSNATSGYLFDAIPGELDTDGFPRTNIQVTLENITLRAPNNPQCGGFNGTVLATFATAGNVSVDVNATGQFVTYPTGTLVGLIAPVFANGALVHLAGSVMVIGYPVGIRHSEHMIMDNVGVQFGNVGVQPYASTGHVSVYQRLLIQGCTTPLQAVNSGFGGGVITGLLDVEGAAAPFALANLIDDAGGRLTGRLQIIYTSAPTKGWPISGAYNLDYGNPAVAGMPGWMNTYPLDTFTRASDPITNNIGVCDQSYHPWYIQNGSWKINGNVLQYVSGNDALVTCRFYDRLAGPITGSRVVLAQITTASTYDIGVAIGRSNSTGNYLWVRLQSGLVRIQKMVTGAATVLATSPAATVAASTAYCLKIVYNRAGLPNAPQTLTVYLGTGSNVITAVYSKVLSYTLTATDQSDVADTTAVSQTGLKSDGFYGFSDDLGSTASYFQVIPLAQDSSPVIVANTAVLVAGTVTVADVSITATSRIRVSVATPGGTQGAPFVSALTAGTGFTIKSTSNTDTSTIYYEIIAY